MIVNYYARKCTHNGNETDKRTEAKVLRGRVMKLLRKLNLIRRKLGTYANKCGCYCSFQC